MTVSVSRGLFVLMSVALVNSAAEAQTQIVNEAQAPAAPIPYTQTTPASAPVAPAYTPGTPASGATSAAQAYTPAYASSSSLPLGGADRESLRQAVIAARRGDGSGAQAAMGRISDPVARKVALWAIIDVEGEQLSFYQLDNARRDLAGWARPSRRQTVTEKLLETSGLPPQQIVNWFQGAEPQSAQGAMALAAADEQLGRRKEAGELIRRWWRDKTFEADVQRTMLTRFAEFLTQDDHVARADALLYGAQGPAARDLLPLLPPDQRALAEARMAFREELSRANGLVDTLPASVQSAPGLAVERAHYLHKHNLDSVALGLLAQFPSNVPNEDAAKRIWGERKLLINAALRAQDYRAALAAATHHGLLPGPEYAEAEFYAGWIALSKLHDPAQADAHFANLEEAGASPITQGRALYWRGRAAEARGDAAAAKAFYVKGARYYTAFYGQLAAEKAGITTLTLGGDPVITAEDRVRFNAMETVRGAKMLADIGQHDLFRLFVLSIAENLTRDADAALLVDLARSYGDQDLSMRAVRTAAQHGFILPERGYPMRSASYADADPAIVFGVIRQESGFDPHVRSGVGARGMMQLMPTTAKVLARRMGERRFSVGRLDEPDYNIRMGSAYIGGMINDFGGSYVMATAAYNAGPGRPTDWAGFCGDPRGGSVDPVDFIECIPFSETRNYVMRVLEGAQVYRARLHGGSAPLTLAEDLKRGRYVYPHPSLIPTSDAQTAASEDKTDPIGALIDQH